MRWWVGLLMVLACANGWAQDGDTEIARRQYEAGEALFQAGRYEAAIQEFESARRIKPLNAFNYNIGICYERMGRLRDAVEAFQRYVDAEPQPRDAAEVRVRIDALRRRLPPEPPPVPIKPIAPPPVTEKPAWTAPPPAPRRSRALPIAIGVSAVALLVTGGALYGVARGDYDALRSSCAPGCAPSRWAGDPALEKAGIALLAVGGAAVVVDVVLWIVATRRHEAKPRASANALTWKF